jgi:hypothetical protein
VPKQFRWEKYFKNMSETMVDTFLATNFSFCALIFCLGLLGLYCIVYKWDNVELITLLLVYQSVFMLVRIIYGVVRPMRLPQKKLYTLFLILFLSEFLLFFIPLLLIALNKTI